MAVEEKEKKNSRSPAKTVQRGTWEMILKISYPDS